ncbi:hypothetical protein GCM10008012_00010 [Rhizobium anhuiense]|nr:hypothetical protein GCM10008012_00010 [Rhizobium anhuiense]
MQFQLGTTISRFGINKIGEKLHRRFILDVGERLGEVTQIDGSFARACAAVAEVDAEVSGPAQFALADWAMTQQFFLCGDVEAQWLQRPHRLLRSVFAK